MTRIQKQWMVVVGVLGLAAVIRFWAIDGRPGYEWDEPVYTNIATHLAHLGVLGVKPDFGSPVEPYLYHPPFYFLTLAGWFKLVGAGMTSARVLAGLMSLVFMTLAYLFMRRYLGRAAIIVLVLLATDGWLVYCNRISWIENTLLVIVIAAVWLYATAVETGSRNRFLAAGLLIGSAAIFKHVGAYLVPVVLLHWLIIRKQHRQHLQLLTAVGAVVVAYLIGMTIIYQHGGHNDYWTATFVQFERTFGNHDSRGTVGSVGDFIKPTVDQYYIFYATILLALAGVVLVVGRTVEAIRWRDLHSIRPYSLLYAWSAAGLACFAIINLKFPQYSLLVLVPLYMYLAVEVAAFVRERFTHVRMVAIAGLVALVVVNAVTYVQRIVTREDNALAAVGQYAQTYLPPQALVITEEAVGDVIPQPYCKLYHVRLCKPHADYVIIYRSFTQEPPPQPGLERLVQKSTKEATFTGFKERITVYKIKKIKPQSPNRRPRRHHRVAESKPTILLPVAR
ncbi:MAG: glycosyltransferase family 39 protein [bacterium]|nr:glycosyltransferase family 39 protein [bacterium]MDZ4248088.1 glycosyltransferase family 39 protein [Patescibacteria group bacterium]